jgi:sulfide:quinone oxidoreductase
MAAAGGTANTGRNVSRDDSKPPSGLRVLIAGGGVAGLETALALRALAEERVDIELLAAESHFWYRPLAVVEPFELGRAETFELAGIASALGARLTLGSLASVDTARQLACTAAGAELSYDALVLALGARPEPALGDGLTFRGPADSDRLRELLEEADGEGSGRFVFAVPGEAAWPLPAYELALLTASQLPEVEVVLVTPESRPLGLFGAAACDAIERLLEARGVTVHTASRPIAARNGVLQLSPAAEIRYDRLVTLPRLRPDLIAGIPQDRNGFVVTDLHGRVNGVGNVYAAGDLTAFPVKQGGIAAQQADAVAEAIAARAGADITPQPFRPVLRGLLLTGERPTFLRSDAAGGKGETSVTDADPLWWPPGKIVGRYLAPFLAERAGRPPGSLATDAPGRVAVDVELAAPAASQDQLRRGRRTPAPLPCVRFF